MTGIFNESSAGARNLGSALPFHVYARFTLLKFLWTVALATAILLGMYLGHGSPGATAARMASSLVLVAAGWLAWGLWRRGPIGRFVTAIAVGMTLGTVGDFFNAGLLNFVPLESPVLGGIIAFALGHIAYIVGFVSLAKVAHLNDRRTILVAVLAWQLFALVGWYFIVYLGSEARSLVWPALPYSLLLAGTAGVTSGLALQDRRLLGPALGGALFLASDLILAFELFRGSFPYQTECVWLTYGPGQMLIVFSTVIAARLFQADEAGGPR